MNIRNDLVSEVRKYLVGPRDEKEVLSEPPIERYSLGILFPRGADTDALDADDFDSDTEDRETADARDLATPQVRQSAIGLRVDIADNVKTVDVEIAYGKYLNAEDGWQRVPLRNGYRYTVNLAKNKGKEDLLGSDGTPDAQLNWTFDVRTINGISYRVLNVFLENSRVWIDYEKKTGNFDAIRTKNNINSIFQPRLVIHSTTIDAFQRQRPKRGRIQTAEDCALDLTFRDTAVFGVGFNCAATWDNNANPSWVGTEMVPEYDAPAIGKESCGNDGRPSSIRMHTLAYAVQDSDEAYRKQFEVCLRPIVVGYNNWIDSEMIKLTELKRTKSHHIAAAQDSLRQCQEAYGRMEDGLEFLLAEGNDKVRLAFALANRAMLYQRVHHDHNSKVTKNRNSHQLEDPSDPDNPSRWYPFQIAFFLMNVHSIAESESSSRHEVDLLWFPTGGGKTEAYMAIAAFAMIHRRLKTKRGDGLGTTVIMRYTLRLLTLQQFERASTLMCALEFLRRSNPGYGLGSDPFLLGLWVGGKLTPNSVDESRAAIADLKSARSARSHPRSSPMQLIRCPWCATPLDPYCYSVNNSRMWTVVHCKNKSCFFSSSSKEDTDHALPVVTVDTDIYRRCPAMIVATVDKFARMPYRPEISSIFGRVERYCPRHGFLTADDNCGAVGSHKDAKIITIDPLDGPDLIIQDELHLITGPLGSMVGLYETAVDYLSRRPYGGSWVLPKIIGSTATIRGAGEQIRRIFNRKVTRKFPPPGIDKNDSFFWWESNEIGRKYVGVSFSHRSSKYTLAKVYAILLQRVKSLSDSLDRNQIDPYWTLVGYFNSLRELGGTIRLVEDDVASNIQFITHYIPEYVNSGERDPGRPHDGLEELTGRITQSGIREIREALEKKMGEAGCINTLLATNMISVGVDIERLGMMVVHGQTKNASEYIQATGRIGRRPQIPGLIITLYNPYKPRDLSHYEDFTGHHFLLQNNVEPSTLTPFSVGSWERGIHAVLISMIRLSKPHLSNRKHAHDFERSDADDAIEFIMDRYLSVQQVDHDDRGYVNAERYLKSFADNWVRLIQYVNEKEAGSEGVWYHNSYKKTKFSSVGYNRNVLMEEFSKYKDEPGRFTKPTPESLRDVERTIRLHYGDTL